MEKIIFKNLEFDITGEKIYLTKFGNVLGGRLKDKMELYNFVEAQVGGEMKITHMGVKMPYSSEGSKMEYVSHIITENVLEITQKSGILEAKTMFTCYDNTNAVRVRTEYKNIADREITLEDASAFTFTGIGKNGIESSKELKFYTFTQSHHAECQPRIATFYEHGLFKGSEERQNKISFANVGSWSTKEQLPQGIIESTEDNTFLMFQIESNNSWYYEIGDKQVELYLYLGGGNHLHTSWLKKLNPQETYVTINVAIAFGNSLNELLGEMTKYRRNIVTKSKSDENLPSIFNEYMHLSWDSPSEENVKKYAQTVAKTGVKYYVIDCGWHNEEDGSIIYPYVGQWKESKKRFPNGVRKTTDYIRSLGMKAGLWIEAEIIGELCDEMLSCYDEDCFMQQFGKKHGVFRRYFLDFRNSKVIEYMSETIRRMVEDYGADYIKIDYNQDAGLGTEYMSDSLGEGLEQCANAYLSWIDTMEERFPHVVFEACSSGGMRMDYKTLSHFSLVSTSDQISYKKYPYIAANILSSVLPEQAAVWSYPVSGIDDFEEETIKQNITDEVIALNMINSFLGRMHLASHLELLPQNQLNLVKDGVKYYESLTDSKKKGLPYLPMGFADFTKQNFASGYVADNKLYLAVWNLGGKDSLSVTLDKPIKNIKVGYPESLNTDFVVKDNILTVNFNTPYMARFFEIEF